MATIEEMSLARQVLQLGMTITAQGCYQVNVKYHGHVDSLDVWVHEKLGGGLLAGWAACDHTVYLGDFHRRSYLSDKPSNEAAKQLKALLKEMDSLLKKDADGVPL